MEMGGQFHLDLGGQFAWIFHKGSVELFGGLLLNFLKTDFLGSQFFQHNQTKHRQK